MICTLFEYLNEAQLYVSPNKLVAVGGKIRRGVQEHMHNITENLKEYNLSGEKMQATEASLEHILFLTASFFEDME